MAAAQLTSPSPLAVRCLPLFEGLRSAKVISNVNFSVACPRSTSRSFRGLVVNSASGSATKYTSVKPLGGRVLIKTKTLEAKSSGGILLPTSARPKPQSGEVVAVGPGIRKQGRRVPVAVKTGSEVVFFRRSGTKIEVEGSTHLMMKESAIIGVLETDDVKDLKPLYDRVLIKVTEAEYETPGGLLLTEVSKNRPFTGTVVATGPGYLNTVEGTFEPLSVSPGDVVWYSRRARNYFKGRDGSVYVALKVSGVIAVVS